MKAAFSHLISICVAGFYGLFFATSVIAQPVVNTGHKDEAEQWLRQMINASEKVNYAGVIAYQYGDTLVSAKLFQRYSKGKSKRRLVYLDDTQEEVIRDGDTVKFIVGQSVRQNSHSQNQQIERHINHNPELLTTLTQAYQLKVIGSERIAGHEAIVLSVRPHDNYRHAHRLSLDKNSALLLKSEIVDQTNQVLERFQFVDLTINSSAQEISEDFMAPSPQKIKQALISTVRFMKSKKPPHALPWQVNWKPSNYHLVSSKSEAELYSTCIYSDGMSSFSVFIEPDKTDYAGGVMRHGANIVVSRPIKVKNQVKIATVVGNIPDRTAERIIQSIQMRP